MKLALKSLCAPSADMEPYDVGCLKKVLNRLGYYTPPKNIGISTIPDTGMFNGLKKFQQDYGLKATSRIAPHDETEAALNKALNTQPKGLKLEWHIVKDDKVRPEHAALNGHVFPTDSEELAHLDDHNCRCWVESPTKTIVDIDDPPIEPVYPIETLIGTVISGNVLGLLGRTAITNILKSRPSSKPTEPPRINFNRSKLQHSFKHSKDFGIEGPPNNITLKKFETALRNQINSSETKVIRGKYHKEPVTHYFDPKTKNNIIVKESGDFEGSWKLSKQQVFHVLKDGKLGGSK